MIGIPLANKDWFSAVLWRGWGAMLLAVFSLLLLVSCSGGSDGGGSGSGDRDEPNDGNMFQDVKWEITPFSNSSGAGLEIRWENLEALKGLVDLRYLLVTIRGNSSHGDREYNISITDFEDTIYRLTNLTDGEAYKVVDASIDLWTSDGLVELPIDWLGSSNGDAHKDTSAGIEVGSNYDKDGLADRVDPDDDNDGIDDFYSNGSRRDVCPFLAVLNGTDHIDTDGDRLGDACDPDDDNDGLSDTDEGERQVNKDGVRCSLLRDCDGDRLADNHTTERRVNKDGVSCSLLEDCDNDTLADSDDLCPFLAAANQADNIDTDGDRLGDACDPDDDNDGLPDTDEGEQQVNKDGVSCSLLVDCDGDTLADSADLCPFLAAANQANHIDTDGDRLGDACDPDDDNDGLPDTDAGERQVNKDGVSCSRLVDCDGDRLADNHTTERLMNEDGTSCSLLKDCDNDTLADNATREQLVNEDGTSCSLLKDCDNDTLADNATREQLVNEDGTSCSLLKDCDGDNVSDADEVSVACTSLADCDNDNIKDNIDACPAGQEDWGDAGTNDPDGDGCHNDEDIDDDGDGLIEIRNADELDAVRHQLEGEAWQRDLNAEPVEKGCGGGVGINACNGYELENDISLAAYSSGQGWRPLAHDTVRGLDGISFPLCNGPKFTGIFEGNGFVISNLTINRPNEDCIGLFGQVTGTIRHLGVLADRVIGHYYVGTLAGYGRSATIIESYVASNEVGTEEWMVGGLVGDGQDIKVIRSYAVNGMIYGGTHDHDSGRVMGGLIGEAWDAEIIQSFAVSGSITSRDNPRFLDRNYIGGLLGDGQDAKIVQSYAVSGGITGTAGWDDATNGKDIGGLVGGLGDLARDAKIIQSYAVSGSISGAAAVGGLTGEARAVDIIHSFAVSGTLESSAGSGQTHGLGRISTSPHRRRTAQASYWDTTTSGKGADTNDVAGVLPKPTADLRSTSYTGLYDAWDDGAIREGTTIAGVDHNGSIWCDEDLSGTIEADEKRDNNRVWDLGTTSQYPALRCIDQALGIDQRAWWSLSGSKPQLNEDLVNATIEGSYP